MAQKSAACNIIEQQGTAQQEQRSTDLLAALLCRVALELAQLATASLAYSTCLVPCTEPRPCLCCTIPVALLSPVTAQLGTAYSSIFLPSAAQLTTAFAMHVTCPSQVHAFLGGQSPCMHACHAIAIHRHESKAHWVSLAG